MILQSPLKPGQITRYLMYAARIAERSDHSIHKMGAVIVKKGQIIGSGHNKNRSHPRSKSYEHMIHAELAALIRAGFWGTYPADLYVVRITKGGSLATSKPCSDCMDLILEAGIEKITYINENGRVQQERL